MKLVKSINKFKEIFWLPLVLIHLFFLINTKFTLWPEIVVYPYLLNKGFLLYKDVINPYPPALPGLLALFAKVFGYFPEPYQILTWTTITIIDLSVVWVIIKLSKNHYHAFFALVFFVILSLPFGINGLWFDLIQTPLVIFSVYYFLKHLGSKTRQDLNKSFYLAIAGLFIKQQILWLIIFYCAYVFFQKKDLSAYLKILIFPVLFFLLLLLGHITFFSRIATLDDFIFWVIYQPLFKGASLPGYLLLPTLKQILILALPLIIVANLVIYSKKKFVLTLLLIPLIMFAYPRFDYFHLVPYLAVASILLGTHLKYWKKLSINRLLLPFGLLILLSVFAVHYFKSNWHQPVRFFEQDIFQTASFLKTVTGENDFIYIQNGPDQLLPLAGRLPTKPWADEFPWYLERGGMQERIVSAMETNKPWFIVYKPYGNKEKYDLGSYRPAEIADYIDRNYNNLTQINDNLWLKVKK